MEVVCLVIGIIIGFVLCMLCRQNKTLGTLEIDMTDPDIPYLRLMANCQVEEYTKHKTVIFKVNPNATFTRQKQGL